VSCARCVRLEKLCEEVSGWFEEVSPGIYDFREDPGVKYMLELLRAATKAEEVDNDSVPARGKA